MEAIISFHNLPEQVSVLGPGAHKWREGVAEEPHDYELTNLGLMPGDIMCHVSCVMLCHSFSED